MKKRNRILGKRALAMFVSLTMCLGMLQITAFAVEDGTGVTDTGVEVEVEKSEPVENADGSTTETWTAAGEDENGVKVEIEGSTTEKETPAETDDDGNVTEPGETETTDRIDVTLTEKGEDHVLVPDSDAEDVAPTEKENMEVSNPLEPVKPDSNVDLKGSGENGGITVSADIGNGHENNTVEDHKEITIDYDTIKDQVEALKPDTSDWGVSKTDSNNKTYWEKPGSADNEVIRKTIEEIKDDNGNVIGYKTITETIRTTEGTDYVETGKTEILPVDPDNPIPPVTAEGGSAAGDVPTKAPAAPEKPEVGATVGDETVTAVTDNEDGSYTVTYEKVTGEPTRIPRVDGDGNPVLDEDGQQIVDLVYPTETRTETFKYEASDATHQVEVTEERKDTVVIDTVVDVNKVDIDNPTLKLDLKMDPVTDNSNFKGADGETDLPDDFIPGMKGLQDYLDNNSIGVNFLVGTTVTVEQTQTGNNAYSANATIKLNLNKSQLDDSFILEVNGTKYRVPSAAAESGDNVLEFDENGNVKNIIVEGVQTGSISLQLTGKQKLNPTAADLGWGDCTSSSMPLVKDVNLSATIQVTITEIKGDLMYEQFKKTETTEDTKTFIRTDTVTESTSSLTTTVTEPMAGTRADQTTQPYTPPVNPPVNPPVDEDGDDDDDDDDDDTTIDDGDVPMAGDSGETDIDDGEVPLAELPEEVAIPEEEVPLAELPEEEPEEVEIPDEDVPLADVPETGDISAMWYAVTLFSACGLIALNVLKKREEA